MSLFSALGNAVGSLIDRNSSRGDDDNFDRNAQLQKEFAQHGIRWKVADAQAAGIHPLYALGANTTSFSPIQISDNRQPLSSSLSDIGQDISRAYEATRTKPERINARMQALQLERAQLDNDFLRAQIAKLNNSQVGPPMPSGQSIEEQFTPNVTPRVEVSPLPLNASDRNSPMKEAGFVSDYTYARTPTGLAVVPSKDVKDRIEDNLIPELMWSLRNNLMPNFDQSRHLPDQNLYPNREGMKWMWDYWNQEFREVPIGSWYRGRVPERR